jgi:hypothetical protein
MSSTKIRINEREGAACRALSATRFHGPFANFLRKIFFKRLPQKASDVAPLSFPFKALKIFSLFPSHLHCIVGRFLILLLLLLSLSLSLSQTVFLFLFPWISITKYLQTIFPFHGLSDCGICSLRGNPRNLKNSPIPILHRNLFPRYFQR